MAARTCLVGERKLVRAGLKHILNKEDFEVVREFEALSEFNEHDADCDLVVIDRPDDASDIDPEITRLRQLEPCPRLVVLAESMRGDRLVASFAAGIDGYLLAEISPEALCESLRLVMLGEKVFPSRLVALLADRRWTAPAPLAVNAGGRLSEREVAIVSRLTMPNKAIANELTITEATVKVHLKSIMKKIGVTNRTQAAIWAINNGVAERTSVDG
jgi:two-component system nitrate/nitrite response regulator NarL